MNRTDDISALKSDENYDDTTIPRSDRSEVALLSAMLLQPSSARSAIEYGITFGDFFDVRNLAIFEIISRFLSQGKPLDFALVLEAASQAPEEPSLTPLYMANVFDFCTSGCNWKYYCDILKEKTACRDAMSAAIRLRLIAAGDSTGVHGAITKEAEAIKRLCAPPPVESTSAEQLDQFVDDLEKEHPAECFGFGLPELDALFGGGFQKGELAVIGGYSGSGKSILLGMAALEAIKSDRKVAYFSLEMPARFLMHRLAANYAGVEIKPRSKYPTPSEMDAAANAISFLRSKIHNIAFAENVSGMLAIEQKCIELQHDLIIIDYIQLVSLDEGDNREQQISAIVRRMKNLAASTNAVVLSASQLNDDGKLRESRAIGQHSDHVISIGQGSTEIITVKNRRGSAGGKIDVCLRGAISRFE